MRYGIKFLCLSAVMLVQQVCAGQAVLVKLQRVEAQQQSPIVEAQGTALAHRHVAVQVEAPGRIQTIAVKSGQFVHQGDVLFQLERRALAANAKAAQAEALLMKKQLQRTTVLLKKHQASQSGWDQLNAQAHMAAAQAEKAQVLLDQATIKAPFSGYIGLIQHQVGAMIMPGEVFARLAAKDPIWVDFSLPQEQAEQVQEGAAVTALCQSTELKGQVIAKDAVLDRQTHALILRAQLSNHEGCLAPGAFVVVSVAQGSPIAVIEVPVSAVIYGIHSSTVYVADQGKAKAVAVTLGAEHDGVIDVLKGLNTGDQLVISGAHKLWPGAAIQTAPAAPQAGA